MILTYPTAPIRPILQSFFATAARPFNFLKKFLCCTIAFIDDVCVFLGRRFVFLIEISFFLVR